MMKMTKRAKKRIGLLAILLAMAVVAAWFALELRAYQRKENGRLARAEGAVAIENGDWEEALSQLSEAAASNPDDIGLIIDLADVRSRVTAPNNQHLDNALRYYRDALEKSRSVSGPDAEALQIAALKGCADMELAMGQLARAVGSCEQILELDPDSAHALQMLVAVKTIVGDYLPDSTSLLRKAGRSTKEWLDACRAASDVSALRWRLELLNQDPDSVDLALGLLATLRDGGAEGRQGIEDIEPETAESLIRSMAAESSVLSSTLPIFIAEERLRKGDREGAIQALRDFDESKIDEPRVELMVVYLYDRLDSVEFIERRDNILSKLTSTPPPSAEVALQLARRYWANNRLEISLEVLGAFQDATPDDTRIPIMGAILASQLEDPSLETWIAVLQDQRKRTDLSISTRDQLQVTLRLLAMGQSGVVDRSKVGAQFANMGRWFQDPIMMTLVGDLAVRAGLDSAAISAYESALQVIGEASIVSRRLVAALIRTNQIAAAFRRAAEFANSNQSLASFLILADAWIRLEASGVEATEILPEFDRFENPARFLEQIANQIEGDDAGIRLLTPLLIRAEIVDGRRDEAGDRLLEYLESCETDDDLAGVLALASSVGIAIPESKLQGIIERSDDPRVLCRVAIQQAEAFADDGNQDAGAEVIRSRMENEQDPGLRRQLAMAFYNLAEGDYGRLEEASRLLGEGQLAPEDLLLRLDIAISTSNRALAGEIVLEVRREFGTPSVESSLAEGLFTLAFDAEDPNSIAKALASADRVFSSGEGSPRLAMVLARLYLSGEAPRRLLATEVLMESLNRYPASLANLLFLITELQSAGRFSLAGDYLDSAINRQKAASPSQRRFLFTLLGRQGDNAEAKRSICEIAGETGDVGDLLACMRLHYEFGDVESGDVVLDQIVAMSVVSSEIDLAVADRLIREEGLEVGLAFLEEVRSFDREMDRAIEVASRLMDAELFERAIERLARDPGEAFDSARAQLLLAICETRITGDDSRAILAMLDRVLELQPDDLNYVGQALNLMLANPKLRASVPRYLPRLKRLSPELAELIAIRMELAESTGTSRDTASLASRVKATIDARPDILAAWSLLIELQSDLYADAVSLGDVDAIARIREEMLELRAGFLQRFPKNSTTLARAVDLSLWIGDLEEARLLARDLSEGVVGRETLGLELPMARVLFTTGEWEEAIAALSPFKREILARDTQVPIAFQILILSKLAMGEADEAFADFRSKLTSKEELNADQEAVWFRMIGNGRLPSSARIAGVRVFEENLGSEVTRTAVRLAAIELLTTAAREMKDAGALLSEIERRIDAIDVAGDQCLEIQLQGLIFEVDFIRDPEEAILKSGRWLAAITREFMEEISKAPELEGEMKVRIGPCYRSTVILLNNYLARFGQLVLDGQLSMAGTAEIAPIAEVIERDLAGLQPFNPDVLDTRATYMLASDRFDEALELASLAVGERPGSPQFRLTLAKTLREMGRSSAASEAASHAVQLERIKIDADPVLLQELQQIRDSD